MPSPPSAARSFTVPDNVNEDRITANLDKGVLELVVPKVSGWLITGNCMQLMSIVVAPSSRSF